MSKYLSLLLIASSGICLSGCGTPAERMANRMGLTEEEKKHLTLDDKMKLTSLWYQRSSALSSDIMASAAVQANIQNAYRPPVNTYNQVYYYGR